MPNNPTHPSNKNLWPHNPPIEGLDRHILADMDADDAEMAGEKAVAAEDAKKDGQRPTLQEAANKDPPSDPAAPGSGTSSDASPAPSTHDDHDDGNVERVAVHVRVRPSGDQHRCLELVQRDNKALRAYPKGLREGGQLFRFDGVMDEFTPQQEVYSTVVEPLIPGVFEVCHGR